MASTLNQGSKHTESFEIFVEADDLIRSICRSVSNLKNVSLVETIKKSVEELKSKYKNFSLIFKQRIELFVDQLTKKEKKGIKNFYIILKKSLEFSLLEIKDLEEILTLQNYQAYLKIDSELTGREDCMEYSELSESKVKRETKIDERQTGTQSSQKHQRLDILPEIFSNNKVLPKTLIRNQDINMKSEVLRGGEENKEQLFLSKKYLNREVKMTEMIRLEDWDHYEFQKIAIQSLLDPIPTTVKKEASAKITKKLTSLFEKPDLSDQKTLQKLEAKILKYCAEEHIMSEAKCIHYGQRNGPSFFHKTNYNISVDGTLQMNISMEAMSSLSKRFENLANTYEDHFYCKLYPSRRFGVPKLLFYSKSNSVSLIITINDEIGKASSELIRAYREFSPLANQLLMLIKLWSAIHGISQDDQGFLSPFAWENLVVGFLQHQGILPSFQKDFDASETKPVVVLNQKNEASEVQCQFGFEKDFQKFSEFGGEKGIMIFELVVQFFRFYLERYVAGDVISIRNGGLIRSGAQKKEWLIAIEDPIISGFDVGSSCFRNSDQGRKILMTMHETLDNLVYGNVNWLFTSK